MSISDPLLSYPTNGNCTITERASTSARGVHQLLAETDAQKRRVDCRAR